MYRATGFKFHTFIEYYGATSESRRLPGQCGATVIKCHIFPEKYTSKAVKSCRIAEHYEVTAFKSLRMPEEY